MLLVSHDRALIDAVADRTLALEDGTIRSYDGGWADYIRRRDELAEPTPPPEKKKAKQKPPPTVSRRPSELEQLEAQIAEREQGVAALESKLAEDWADVETLQAHRRAREELQSLLERWEVLFERSQA